MILTEEDPKKQDHIPTEQILKDIKDTQEEIDDFKAEREILRKRPQENRLRLYLLDPKIAEREKFIENLNQILKYRKEVKNES